MQQDGGFATWFKGRKLLYPCGNGKESIGAGSMSAFWVWWIATAVLIGAELLTGTFYLLAIGIAAALGGVVAWLGADLPVQFLIAGVFGVALTFAAHRWRLGHTAVAPQQGLDVGKTVRVKNWNADGTARVAYRGTLWDAELASPGVPHADTLYIVATRGSVLVLSDRQPVA
jgi:membrane protein implicated in regulation of membrane protease activity